MNSDPLRQIFESLTCWRHLPSYQLERRLDVFLTPYLKELIEKKLVARLRPVIVPEMPLKQAGRNHTDKVDYVMFSEDGATAYFVELKTDCDSFRKKQDAYLVRATGEQRWQLALEELTEVVEASRKRRKYVHAVVAQVRRAGRVPAGVAGMLCPARTSAISAQVGDRDDAGEVGRDL